MAGNWTTIPVMDANGVSRNVRVYDEDGAGTALDWGRREVRGDDGADWYYAAAAGGILNSTTPVTIKSAPGGSLRNYLVSLEIMAEALASATELVVLDGPGGAVLWRTMIPTGGLATTCIHFDPPLKSSVNVSIEVATLTASGTGAVFVNAQGFTAI